MWQRGPLWLAAGALAVIAMVLAAGTATRGLAANTNSVVVSSHQPTGINVSGEGKVTVVPDIAVANLSIEARAATIEAAREQAAKGMDAVMTSLKGNGVDVQDIQTRGLNIHPEWRNKTPGEPPQIVGYIVSHQVSVKVRQMAKVTATVDGAIVAGGNALRMQSIQFSVDDALAATALKQARDAAVAEAKAKADQLARLAGVSVGRPIQISDHVTGIPGQYLEKTAAMSRGGAAAELVQTPIEPGRTEVRVTVQATYAIE